MKRQGDKWMKKNIVLIGILIVASLVMVGCGPGRGGLVYMGEEAQADNRMEEIVSAIKEEDSEAMKAMFSSKAQDESEELDQEIEEMFTFIEGDITKWKNDQWSSDESIKHGKRTQQLRSFYIVETDKEIYEFFIIDYPKDTIEQENEGLYTINICIKGKEASDKFTCWQDMVIPGVYTPDYEEYK